LSAVDLDKVTLAVGNATVLSDVSLAVDQGEFIGVLGPNGSGKTTLIRALLGLIRPVAGAVAVLGRPVRRGNPAVGYLPQARSTLPTTSLAGRDLLAVSIDGHRLGLPFATAEVRREIDRVLDSVEGRELAERPLAEMSGGERQRLLIAQALIGKPRLLLLDEPLIGLDPHQQQRVVEMIRRLTRSLGLTVLLSAHELNQLLGKIDRVLYLGNRRAAIGTVDEVIRPAVLSPLYGAPIQVVRADGHIFVMSHGRDIERDYAHGHSHA